MKTVPEKKKLLKQSREKKDCKKSCETKGTVKKVDKKKGL